ncbi:MAG: Ca-activated chloride channel family protein [Cryomorphaceae bacterium]|jgi:Ca-activated chloride channel family protein
MISWQWPELFYLLPLPLLVRLLLPAVDRAAGAIRVPFYEQLNQLDQSGGTRLAMNWLRAMLIWLVWGAVITAAARPAWVGEPVNMPQERRDLMLAVDISPSMQEKDMLINNSYVDRITAVKAVVGEFVEKRAGDRLGLILFAQQGYLQTPLTFDSKTVNQQLQEAQLGFAGNRTAIGDAIGLAIKRLRYRPADSRVLILLTDGANTAGTEPLTAAGIADQAKIRIHTVGIGADVKYSKDLFGRTRTTNPSSDLDEKTLKNIALRTGGQYFRARDPQELENIYIEIDRLEPIPEEQMFRPTRSLAYWPMLFALLMSVLMAMSLRRAG